MDIPSISPDTSSANVEGFAQIQHIIYFDNNYTAVSYGNDSTHW